MSDVHTPHPSPGPLTGPSVATGASPAQPEIPLQPRLLDQVRDSLRRRRYSLRTEKVYVHWIRRFILFHGKRHPREMGAEEVTQYNRICA